jgi:phosphoribosylformylglycinamidine (FGAM) synthase-like enzyme
MGAAGLTSSSVEMGGKGNVGVEMNMDAVPQRETGMSAYEIMLSESQERMLMVLKPGREARSPTRSFDKWGLDFAVIGKTTDTGNLVLKHKGEIVCDIPIAAAVEDAPNYTTAPWTSAQARQSRTPKCARACKDLGAALIQLMAPRHRLQALDLGAV